MATLSSTPYTDKSHGQRSLVGCSSWGYEESDMTEWLHFHFSHSCIRERNGNPLQCSCLENPRDGGAWWAAIYGSHGVGHDWSNLAAAVAAAASMIRGKNNGAKTQSTFSWGSSLPHNLRGLRTGSSLSGVSCDRAFSTCTWRQLRIKCCFTLWGLHHQSKALLSLNSFLEEEFILKTDF